MVLIPFGPDKIRVAPPTAEAFEALAAVMLHHRYEIRTQDTDSYSCRAITGGSGRSLHSYGIALDVNWQTNPFLDHQGTRPVRFSDKATQAERGRDVRFGLADTDMTPAMIADVEKIKTTAGVQVFEWGGSWKDRKDCMHFELDLSPAELAVGIDPATVVGRDELLASGPPDVAPDVPAAAEMTGAETTGRDPHVVIARDGLRLRSGPSTTSDVVRVIPEGTRVNVIARLAEWAQVDLEGDGLADGFMSLAFLRPVIGGGTHGPGGTTLDHSAPVGGTDITGIVVADMVARMFPATPKSNIAANLPFVLAGLRSRALGDRPMVLMALATIRAETEGFVPISEGRSKFNTLHAPFDLYEPGTSAGNRIGNTQPGDGPRFKGRGYVQLTGRFNYTRVSGQVGVDLVGNPEAANDPTTAGVILAQFLKNHEAAVRQALASNDLKRARKLVNGGSHGLDRFRDAFERGLTAIPA